MNIVNKFILGIRFSFFFFHLAKKSKAYFFLFLKTVFTQVYCKDGPNTGYRIRPGPSKIKPRLNPNLTPESA